MLTLNTHEGSFTVTSSWKMYYENIECQLVWFAFLYLSPILLRYESKFYSYNLKYLITVVTLQKVSIKKCLDYNFVNLLAVIEQN